MSISNFNYPSCRPLNFKRFAKIAATGKGVPDNIVTNDDIIKQYNLIASDRAVRYSVGIEERRWATPDETNSDLLLKAAEECFDKCDIKPEQIDRIIHTRIFGDHCLPGTSIKVLQKMGLRRGIPCIDMAAACSGFAHALDMALRYIDSGDDYILILAGDKSPAGMNLDVEVDTTTIFLPGDGVAGCILAKSDVQHFFASYLYTDSSYYDYSYLELGSGLLNSSDLKIADKIFLMQMPSGSVVHDTIMKTTRICVDHLLEASGLTIEDIDIFVTSDQTTQAWKDQCKLLGIPEEKSISLFKKFGNTIAAMAPMNLNALVEKGTLKRGMTVLLTAHGAGASGGGFIFTF